MSKFDKRVKEILNEGILGALGSGLGAAATFAGSAINAAKSPAEGLSDVVGGVRGVLKKQEQQQEQMKGKPFSVENPPKVGQIVVTKSPVLGVGKKQSNPDYEPDILKRKPNASPREIENANREFLPSKTMTLVPNATIYGKITKGIDKKDGSYGVALTDERGNPTQKYVFAQTESAPFWQVYDATKTPDDDILMDQKGIPMKLTAIMTGPAKDDVSDQLRGWVDYKNYIEQAKR